MASGEAVHKVDTLTCSMCKQLVVTTLIARAWRSEASHTFLLNSKQSLCFNMPQVFSIPKFIPVCSQYHQYGWPGDGVVEYVSVCIGL